MTWLFFNIINISFFRYFYKSKLNNMKKLAVLLIIGLFISCTSDSKNATTAVTIKGYKITTINTYEDASNPTYKMETTGNLQNGKLFSETYETFIGGVSQGTPVTIQHYFYEGNLLSSTDIDFFTSTGKVADRKYFFYDKVQNLVGLNWDLGNKQYFRFKHISNTVVYFERITLPYNDTSAQVIYRNIIEFDQNNNVIKAGRDNDLDGIVDNQYQYFYTNDNLTSVHKPDGSMITFEYSNVIDNFSVLNNNSYGKKVLGLLCSEAYALCFKDVYKHSNNLLKQDLLNETYEVLDGNYYKKKTLTQYLEYLKLNNITTTDFFFN